MKKSFSFKSDNFHLNRRATAPAFAIRFKCKSFLPAGKTPATGNGRRPVGERPSFDLWLLEKKGRDQRRRVGNRTTWLPKNPLKAGKRPAFAIRIK
jgi:hypothetical protein